MLSAPELCTKNKCQVKLQILLTFTDAFKEWKFKTFKAISEKMDRDTITNIVAIGDSQIEIDAANSLAL